MSLVRRPNGLPHRIPAWAWKWLKWRSRKPTPNPTPAPVPAPKPKPKPKPVTMLMFDDVNVSLIPANAQAIAGYSDGHYQTWAKIKAGWPHAKKLMIAVFAQDNGDCLDVEPGDASVMQAPAWVKKQLANWSGSHHDVARPVVYTSASQAQALVSKLNGSGLKYGQDYLLWTAHYDPAKGKHLCSPRCGFGLKVTAHATQYTDHALGRSLDESLCGPGFFK